MISRVSRCSRSRGRPSTRFASVGASCRSRYRVLLGTTCAFVLCNMDKVNISVAIIPMAKEMGWTVGQAGLLQSAFFYGFALSQLPGGSTSPRARRRAHAPHRRRVVVRRHRRRTFRGG